MSSRNYITVVMAGAIVASVSVFYYLHAQTEEGEVAELKTYAVCDIEFGGKKKSLNKPDADHLFLACQSILGQRALSKQSQQGDFKYDSGESLLFFVDETKKELACRVDFWALYPKRARFSFLASDSYFEVPDRIYQEIRNEIRSKLGE